MRYAAFRAVHLAALCWRSLADRTVSQRGRNRREVNHPRTDDEGDSGDSCCDVCTPASTMQERDAEDYWQRQRSKLRDTVQTHGGKDWAAISALIPGRTGNQCWGRWKNALDPSIALMAGRTGEWAEDEDCKLKDAVQTHGAKNWAGVAALAPSRTRLQCRSRWQTILNPSISRGIDVWVNGQQSKTAS
jgi:hypothetical protein